MARAHLPILLACLLPAPVLASGSDARAADGAGRLCQAATAAAELDTGVPNQLLDAISRVESGRHDPDGGGVVAWPWTINAQGKGHFYASQAEAVAAARGFQAAGIQSIDVGCMQVNLMYHPGGFASLEQAFDPRANALYAARFLTTLFHQTGSWPHAAAAYHSQTPDLGVDYQNKVLQAWAEPIDRPRAASHAAPARQAAYADASSPPAIPAPAVVPAVGAPMGMRPLGGFGHVIRMASAGGGRGALLGLVGRDLAAYRALPVAVAFLPQRR